MLKTKKLTEKDLPIREETACTIGNFDGFHIGHQKILQILKQKAEKENIKSVVITFDPHPKKFFKNQNVCTITNLETRLAFLSKMGIDYMLVLRFDENFYKKSPEEFIQFLKDQLNCKLIVVGEDWRFGYKKAGDINIAKQLGEKLNIKVIPVKPQLKDSKKISSTQIRELLKKGEVDRLKELLGRKYCIFGKIVKGSGMGKRLGFPTINIKLPEDMCLKRGVYAGYVIIKDKLYPAAINFGTRPTVDGKDEFLEVHILKPLKQNLELEYIKVIFEKFVREEKKFSDINQLKKQIEIDIKRIKEVLDESKNAQ